MKPSYGVSNYGGVLRGPGRLFVEDLGLRITGLEPRLRYPLGDWMLWRVAAQPSMRTIPYTRIVSISTSLSLWGLFLALGALGLALRLGQSFDAVRGHGAASVGMAIVFCLSLLGGAGYVVQEYCISRNVRVLYLDLDGSRRWAHFAVSVPATEGEEFLLELRRRHRLFAREVK